MPIDIPQMFINIKAVQNSDWNGFWTAVFGAGFGALSAYWLNRRSENIKENNKNINSLKCLTQVLMSQFQILADLKVNVSEKQIAELNKIKNDFMTGATTEMRKATASIFHVEHFLDFDISRIDFSINNDPNFFHFVSMYFNQVASVKRIITEYNNYVSENIHHKETKGILQTDTRNKGEEIIHRLDIYISGLARELDNCILMNYKTINNCRKYGIEYFGPQNTMEVTFEDEYKGMLSSIKPIKWYEVKERSFVEKHMPNIAYQYKKMKSKYQKAVIDAD
ncbi:MAG: hypothetical protein PHC64_01395 [Candidatus Gastranaerophilales bacterium]|nr:hypothetical protein [Candidatus Gastranaerophilales bacterium]